MKILYQPKVIRHKSRLWGQSNALSFYVQLGIMERGKLLETNANRPKTYRNRCCRDWGKAISKKPILTGSESRDIVPMKP